MAGLGYHIRRVVLGTSIAVALGAVPASAATPAPAWQLGVSSLPTHFAPGATNARYFLVATNLGGAAATGPTTISNVVPTGLTPVSASGGDLDEHSVSCDVADQVVTCTDPGPVPSGGFVSVEIRVQVDPLPEGAVVIDQATVASAGAWAEASAATTISTTTPPFGFLRGASGPRAVVTEADGSAASKAGAHPYQLTAEIAFPSVAPGDETGRLFAVDGGLRDLVTFLPRGMIVDPSSSPVRCAEEQLESDDCPDAAAIGTVSIGSTVLAGAIWRTDALYDMVPPPGAATSFGFNALGIGAYMHLLGGMRRGGDHALFTSVRDVLARPENPVLSVQVQLWGDPSDPSHDRIRGHCLIEGGACPTSRRKAPFLTNPGECSQGSLFGSVSADSWIAPGAFEDVSYEYADGNGTPVAMTGCGQLEFEPALELRPTTSFADSPSGLEVELRQEQRSELGTPSTAALRDAVVTLPPGLTLNPSAAGGLAACDDPEAAAGCPDAAKIGATEVETPLLAHPLAGSIYLARPFDNPFGSLVAVYLVVDDAATGIAAVLAGEVRPDPRTGQLTARFEESPALPIAAVRLDFFSGPRGLLVTPPTCRVHTASARFTPWSSPEGGDALRSSSFSIANAQSGFCPDALEHAPHSPAFAAGVTKLQAGAYAPFAFDLSREDGSQRLAAIDTILPAGLSGRLAGVPYCSAAEIAAAACPAAAEIGTVDIGAGAGIAPLHLAGRAYLAGPYKGAPLSLAVVVPALAGPFDLGTEVVRVALHVDPRTARVHAVSDPLPAILRGVPLDIRSISLNAKRPNFTRTPTSCDPMAIVASVSTQSDQVASLGERFQVGDCGRLGFKPKVSLRLLGRPRRGAHPQLRTTVDARRGDANVRRLAITLPGTELLDNRRIGAVCTRERFGSGQCPAGAAYGYARAWTPLLDRPLEGPVYLRAGNGRLPDLAARLHGQVSLDLTGRIDAVDGRLRTTFGGLPDVPLERVVLTLHGGRRGLLVNTGGLCARERRAGVELDAHNGKTHDAGPVLRTDCRARGTKK